jgi:2-amino-4-hydroxy-6-hydroxymethyldihydropteridine diphosphokinase
MSGTRSSRYNQGVNSRPVTVAIGLGSNIGDRAANLAYGRSELERHGVSSCQYSSIYETAPFGTVQEQDLFLNQVVIGETELPPQALLGICLRIERECGRVRSIPGGPRTLDLDLLLYGDRSVNEPDLRTPHPRLTQRAFVLTPLAEIAPEWLIPETGGKTVAECAAALMPEQGVSLWQSTATKRRM